jgi:hypothetical protein
MARSWLVGLAAAAAIASAFTLVYVLFFTAVAGPAAGLSFLLVPSLGLVAIASSLVLWHARRRAAGKESLPPPRPLPAPVPPLDEGATSAAAGLAPPFTACPDCGYLGIRYPGVREGVWLGGGETGGRFVCPRCHYQGIPIEFESGAQYAAFVRELNEDRPAPA